MENQNLCDSLSRMTASIQLMKRINLELINNAKLKRVFKRLFN